MNIDRPTPETERIKGALHTNWNDLLAHARTLERERDEAREKAERYRIEANAIMLQRDEWAAMCGRYKQERDIAEDERIDLAKQLRSEKERHAKCQNERDEARAVAHDLAVIASHCLGWHDHETGEAAERISSVLKSWKKL